MKTTEKVVVPMPYKELVPLKNLVDYEKYGYGRWEYKDGEPNEPKYELMENGYQKPDEKGKELLSFAVITDIHITDKESPLQVIALGLLKPFFPAYSPVSLYSTQVLNAIIDKVNEINEQQPLDFLISLGDNCNNTQKNELRWFIDVLDGKFIRPSSGKHIGESEIDYQKTYKSAGLNIPWYQVIGNHDEFWTGTFAVEEKDRKTLVGNKIVDLSTDIIETGDPDKKGYYMGVFDCSTPEGRIIGVGTEVPKDIDSDDERCSLVTDESCRKNFMLEFYNTISEPSGHGFTKENIENDFACYSFYPKKDMPIKIIVIDDTNPDGNTRNESWIHGHGSMDEKTLEFLESELDKGQKNGELMMVMAHIPILTQPVGSPSGWWKDAPISEDKLVNILHKYPNFIAWVAGHNHKNREKAAVHEDKEKSFWSIENPSLRDFPQQFREIRLFYNIDGTLSIFATSVDYDAEKHPLAEKSRRAAIASLQMTELELGSENHNVELICTLTEEMQKKLDNLNI